MSATSNDCFNKPGRYAAIDIGTVTCRMLVADVDECGRLYELERAYEITNLGEGVDATGKLAQEAMFRVRDVLQRFQEVLTCYISVQCPVINTTVMATSASRDAKNAHEFRQLLADIDIVPMVISGEKEASLSFKGASGDFLGESLLFVDIGGGSTEIVAGVAGKDPVKFHSFDIGCRRVTERFFTQDPPPHSEIQKARLWIRDEIKLFFEDLVLQGFRPDRLVAVAGTATSIVAIREKMTNYDTTRVHKALVRRDELDVVYQQLYEASLSERQDIVGLDPRRAPVIVAGAIILQSILDAAQMESFTTSESDILYGMVFDAALG